MLRRVVNVMPLLSGLSSVFSMAGCVSASAHFIKTNAAYHALAPSVAPKVFVDQPPDVDFGSVGLIEVQGPVTASTDSLITSARRKGVEEGCNVLVSEVIFENRTTTAEGSSGPPISRPSGIATWLFTCGVFDSNYLRDENERLAAAKVREVIAREYGEPVCSMEKLTGTSIAKKVCRIPGSAARMTVVH